MAQLLKTRLTTKTAKRGGRGLGRWLTALATKPDCPLTSRHAALQTHMSAHNLCTRAHVFKNVILSQGQPGMIAHSCNPSTGRRNRDGQEFKVILGYVASWGLAWASQKGCKEVARDTEPGFCTQSRRALESQMPHSLHGAKRAPDIQSGLKNSC